VTPASIQPASAAQRAGQRHAENASSGRTRSAAPFCPFCMQALRVPTSSAERIFQRNRLGGLIRARLAARYADGTFMSDEERDELLELLAQDRYERHAAGGKARAQGALRRADGRFVSEPAH
jgi:hypothetical protein